jgi:delta1-piperideine-2-carboxylate reductase
LGSAAAEHIARAEQLFEGIVAQGGRLPSDRRYSARQKSIKEGVLVDRNLLEDIANLGSALLTEHRHD